MVITQEDRNKHKKTLTNLEINVPTAIETFFKEFIVFESEEKTGYCYCKHTNFNEIKSIHKDLKENFEREVCDLEIISKPDVVYLIVLPLLNPGLILSKKYRYVGIMEVTDDTIQFIWMHPFLRNKGFIKNFLCWYATCENSLAVQPPISKSLEMCLNSVQKEITSIPEALRRQVLFVRNWLKKNSPQSAKMIDQLSDDLILNVKSGCEVASAMNCRQNANLKIAEVIEISCKMQIYLYENPDQKEDVEEWLSKNYPTSELKKLMGDFRKFGSHASY